MHDTATAARGGTIRGAARILRRVAQGYRDGDITWGNGGRLIDDDGRLCLVAAITWAADPHDDNAAGMPFFLRDPKAHAAAYMAMVAVADHLVCEMGWSWSMDDNDISLMDTIGAWSDAQPSIGPVIALAEAVAEIIWPASLAVVLP